MDKMNPVVDIVMATYNGGGFLREQMDSILNQSYSNIRIFIRDDGSSDNTISIIEEYEYNYPEKVFLITDEVKCGSSCSNFMQALKSATADYIMFSDQDDYWLPKKIELTLKKVLELESLVGKDKPVLAFCSYTSVDSSLNPIKEKISNRQVSDYRLDFSSLLVQNYVNGCLMMINRSLADKIGDYHKSILMHDWWAALIASGGGAIDHIDEVMMLYRQHGDNVVGSVDVKSWRYRINKLLDTETKKASEAYRRQAELLKKRNYSDLYDSQKSCLDRFIALFEKRKIIRIKEIIEGRYLKSDFIRVLGQLWYI